MPDDLPLLGVCLGHQGLIELHGGELERDPVPVHGSFEEVVVNAAHAVSVPTLLRKGVRERVVLQPCHDDRP